MDPHGILTLYWTKPIEYLIAIAYLVTFVGFWRYLRAPAARQEASMHERARLSHHWFSLVPDVQLHPGHAWARRAADGLVTVGIDDFASKLVGPLDSIELPGIGTSVRQGEQAPRLGVGDKTVAMLSPVDGRVVAVNQDALLSPQLVSDDPYGRGWLFKVRPERWRANSRQLLSGVLARSWTDGVTEMLYREGSLPVGAALQDGGQPVSGIARELYADRWDEFARTHLLS